MPLAKISDRRMPARLSSAAAVISDWNTALDNGWYRSSSNTTDLNPPATGWLIGFVVGEGSIENGSITQTVWDQSTDLAIDTKTWRRDRNSGVWSAWYRVRQSEAEQNNLFYNRVMVAIPNAVNLNDYTGSGNYYQLANAQAATGANYPVPLAGLLEVHSTGVFIQQRYTVYNVGSDDTAVTFQRAFYNGSWSTWRALNRVTVSTSAPSGTAPEGSMWYQV